MEAQPLPGYVALSVLLMAGQGKKFPCTPYPGETSALARAELYLTVRGRGGDSRSGIEARAGEGGW